jgi:hypothetical protein
MKKKLSDQSSIKKSSIKEILNEKQINAHSMTSFSLDALHVCDLFLVHFDRTTFWKQSSPNTTKIILRVRHYKPCNYYLVSSACRK